MPINLMGVSLNARSRAHQQAFIITAKSQDGRMKVAAIRGEVGDTLVMGITDFENKREYEIYLKSLQIY